VGQAVWHCIQGSASRIGTFFWLLDGHYQPGGLLGVAGDFFLQRRDRIAAVI
jgi:hypothetical protein